MKVEFYGNAPTIFWWHARTYGLNLNNFPFFFVLGNMATLGPLFLLQNLIAFGGKMATLGLLFQKSMYGIGFRVWPNFVAMLENTWSHSWSPCNMEYGIITNVSTIWRCTLFKIDRYVVENHVPKFPQMVWFESINKSSNNSATCEHYVDKHFPKWFRFLQQLS
jgi:hypothetical protein